jgi:hypothetical protein
MSLFNKKKKEKERIEKPILTAGEKHSLKLNEVEKPTKGLTIYDNTIKDKSFFESRSAMIKVNSTEMGLIYSNVTEEMLLALVPELSKYEGSFFGNKVIIENENGKKEEKYPVFFSTLPDYPESFFDKREKKENITGFIYVDREALINNKALGLEII